MKQHPLEDMYAAREALDRAARNCADRDLASLDWPPYGAALLGVLGSLHSLSGELSSKLDQVDRERLLRQALRDHPHEALERAIRDLQGTNAVLASAMRHAEQYWAETQHIHEDTGSGAQG
ncbi:hypothetical protein [Saccharopolyspora dendranthemae]|uniref:Uncharacterized protein n=1 Tax=Saccharopolyspora dendranthemae TaxID=1181886 RepID=A0A561U8D6_9PSEU|nr:hypothetical protein [Saccharopolyspora dendranthemae]TWF95597.1 hypothetical protein FHU35_12595 [Saccharopolyspora dendranthemae]